ncbi:family 20 glycosylhydrolase [Flavitalea sp. BT771]|uniref:beta-N-acetylhexosaminidase n=1 Tax=Flavitalea sp. BT771 TaxID=3063329 RepID=UPI0026E21180|nr:family 20 glycosylhydrolase [Flavitalea sp. BT771]MDO6430475.1 family 20 glycosylhydrolase [Flavitalea sp. BT771]MDV6219385.1 family 20 glycosylhydrolase [Flavitalea sp. BT771]
MKVVSLLTLFFVSICAVAEPIHLIPQPVALTEKPGKFTIDAGTHLQTNDPSLQPAAAWFSTQVGTPLPQGKGGKTQIILEVGTMKDRNLLGKEGYVLTITPSTVRIKANEAAGVFYGLQTLLQLTPPETTAASKGPIPIPCAEITDYPRFGWRGLMLDVSRHFFTKQEVERYIDEMVRYKYNTLHLHLSDDQGWRLEIKSLPMLTQKGAWRVARTGARWGEALPALAGEPATEGGFYTQDDMREIIQYAKQRFVTILPEIDIPAHSLAMIASYPNLSCTQLPYPVNAGFRNPTRDDNALCIGNDTVFEVLDKVFTELAALFPSEYIHIGGDEAYKGFWASCPKCKRRMTEEHLNNVDELQSYFVKRMEKMLKSKGKKLIGWDEILEGGLAPEATVMSWRGMKGGITAARMNHQVVMTPWDFCYLDLYQGESAAEPPTYGICRLKDCYTYDPVPDSVEEKYILGGQGNLWTESVPTFRQVEYMTWPRALALAEVYWSPRSARSWDGFTSRMEHEFQRLDASNIKYARSAYNVIFTPKKADRDFTVSMSTEVSGLDIYYTFDNTNPDPYYPKYDGTPLKFPLGATQLNVITYRNGHPIGAQVNIKKDELAKRLDQGRHVY